MVYREKLFADADKSKFADEGYKVSSPCVTDKTNSIDSNPPSPSRTQPLPWIDDWLATLGGDDRQHWMEVVEKEREKGREEARIKETEGERGTKRSREDDEGENGVAKTKMTKK
jgi:hypothetical protein